MGWPDPDKVWTVRDVMVEGVVTVGPETAYKGLVDLLWMHGISGLPVLDERRKLVGIVSESDLLVREEHEAIPEARRGPYGRVEVLDKVQAGESLTARDLMTSPVVTVGPDATLAEAARLMRQKELKRLPVVDPAGALVGIISRADLLKVFLRSEETIEWDVRELIRRRLLSQQVTGVRVEDGVVRVEGEVGSQAEADQLVAAIDALPGVVAVESGLAVRPPG